MTEATKDKKQRGPRKTPIEQLEEMRDDLNRKAIKAGERANKAQAEPKKYAPEAKL